ncbi:hypothetical protein D8674_022295 [Pyrus ussuriensis x Pyrus communis]|uniref:Uncharacterized protein n=1 Tax=Pyrus ussuriensis x Pyrus communis TaxID=2448454 RepID=A0A5N5GKR2_9ROSA|nr:hypothetical protein D8674_022295 [Pyrus ussuriensis x Pyrus communis]
MYAMTELINGGNPDNLAIFPTLRVSRDMERSNRRVILLVSVLLGFMEVCEASSGGTPKVEAYSDSGLNLWVDLKINSTPKDDLDDGDLPQPTTPCQRSPPQYDLDLNDFPLHTVTPQCSSPQYDLEHRVLPQSTASTQGSTPKYDFDLNELPQPTASPQGSPAQVKFSDLRSHQDSHVEECKNIPRGIN